MLQLAFVLAALLSSYAEEPFRTLTFEQAQAAATQEKKVILIDFFTTWCMPCKKLDATTWKDEAVRQWIGKQCVALKLDAERDVQLAERYHVDAYPTILLLKADGSVIDRLVGYKDAKEFLSSATAALAGKDSLARAREKLVGHEQDAQERQHYGDELARAGKYEEALAEYLWCFDNGRSTEGYSGVRLSFLLLAIQQLGKRYPAAIRALEGRRDAAESRIRAGSTAHEDVADLIALNDNLGTGERSLKLLDELKSLGPIPSRLRSAFFQRLKGPLAKAKRYTVLLDLVDDPVAEVARSIAEYESLRKLTEKMDGEQKALLDDTDSFRRTRVIEDGTAIYEALLCVARGAEADTVSDALISFDATGKTYAALIRTADRAGAAERVKTLGERGLASLPEKEQTVVKKAVGRASKPK